MLLLYSPAVLLAGAALWLVTIGDGIVFGVSVVALLVLATLAHARGWRRR